MPVCDTPRLGTGTVNAVHTQIVYVIETSTTDWQVCKACHQEILHDRIFGKLYLSTLKL